MIRHQVFFRWREGVGGDEVRELTAALREMAASLPMLVAYECGPNLRVRPSEIDYAVTAVTASADDLEAYLDSAQHRAVYDAILGRLVAQRWTSQTVIE